MKLSSIVCSNLCCLLLLICNSDFFFRETQWRINRTEGPLGVILKFQLWYSFDQTFSLRMFYQFRCSPSENLIIIDGGLCLLFNLLYYNSKQLLSKYIFAQKFVINVKLYYNINKMRTLTLAHCYDSWIVSIIAPE